MRKEIIGIMTGRDRTICNKTINSRNISWITIAAAMVFCILMTGMALMINVKNAAAAERYVSEVTVEKGEDGENMLISKGYSVVHPYFLDSSKNQVWIGYKTSSSESAAITDIAADDINTLKGKKDPAKNPVMAIYYMSADVNDVSKFTEVMPLANNGAIPALGSDGNIAVFETENGSGYICMIRNDIWENYIESIACATGKTKKAAVKELCKKGCEYYIDADMSGGDSCTLIGYSRTNDRSKAITDVIGLDDNTAAPSGYEKIADGSSDLKVKKKNIYITKDTAYGNPLVDIDFIEGFKSMEVSGKQWTSLVITRGDNEVTKPYILEDDNYKTMSESTDAYIITKITCDDKTDTGIIITSAKDGLEEKQKAKAKLLKVEVAGEDEDDSESTEESEPVMYDNAGAGSVGSAGDENGVTTDETEDEVANADADTALEDEESSDDIQGSGENGTEDGEDTSDEESQEEENADQAGTIINTNMGRMPGKVEMIVLLSVIILIPLVTIVLKKRIENGSKKKTKQ